MRARGFTLIELVIVMALLAVVSMFSIQFITKSVQIYKQGTDREQLMSDIRFGIERLNREVRNAVPGSLRIEDTAGNKQTGTGACVRFWTIDTARRYKNIEQSAPSTTSKVTIPARLDKDGNIIDNLDDYIDSWMIISPLNLNSSTQQCSEDAADPACAVKISNKPSLINDNKDLAFLVDNITRSSTKRVFFAKNQVRYCITPEQWLTRAETVIDSAFDPPVTMAEHISKGHFSTGSGNTGEDADLYSQLNFDLTASNHNEHISFSHKIRLYNAP